MKFSCTKCGECCRHIDKIPQLASFDSGNGICIYLKDNLCSIYNHRPDICRVDVMYKKYYWQYYTIEEYYLLNQYMCDFLQYSVNSSLK